MIVAPWVEFILLQFTVLSIYILLEDISCSLNYLQIWFALCTVLLYPEMIVE